MHKVQNFVEQVQELLDNLEEGSYYGSGIEFMNVDHTVPEK